ncbi:MAG: LuxR C-terminal-related transcriptional regulator [Caldilineaceae bacterium]
MPTPILATKLYAAPPRPNLVERPRLFERLNAGLHCKLTLISAPAGFGKTTLISAWIADKKHVAAWLALDKGDSDPARFLAYLVAALQTISTEIGEEIVDLLDAPQLPPLELLLTALLNELATIATSFILVLDDYHVLDSPAINEALAFLLDHLPPQMQVVITTREDPNLPLARYRARGQLSELRAIDLRFTPDEAAQLLNRAMGLTLSAEEIAALETRTEGWITGLQLAALALQGLATQGRTDVAGFIKSFTGSHHFILDYLLEEVLQQQPDHVRRFLLQTAILDRLSGPLCDAVTGQENGADDGKAMLTTLARDNLFVVPLDDRRQWYRYHHLFADVLQARLQEEQSTQIATLHRRASDWYEQHDMRNDAIRHAFAAKDFEQAANLVELAWPGMHRSTFRSPNLVAWLEAIPDELIHARPVLTIGYAWELLNGGEFEGAEAWLQDAEGWLERLRMNAQSAALPATLPPDLTREMVVMDQEEFRFLPAEVASARAYLAQARGDMAGTATYAQQALDFIPKDDHIRRGPAASLLGLAYWTTGNLDAAYRALAEGMDCFRRAGNILFAISGTFGLADMQIAQGRLHAAISTYEQSLALATKRGDPKLLGTADLHLGLSELYREQGHLTAAEEHLRQSEELGWQAGQPVYEYHRCLVQARRKQDRGDLDGALRLLDEAEDLFVYVHIQDFRPVAALKARVQIAQGQVTEALRWVNERGLSVDDELSYLREFEHMALARVLIAHYKHEQREDSLHDAMGLLVRLLAAAEAGGRVGSVIEILLLLALVDEAREDVAAALVPLERALTLAEPEGYVRIFLDEGPAMAGLLEAAAKQGIAPHYLQQLLAAFGQTDGRIPIKQPVVTQQPAIIEPLSDRELDVLRLLSTELSGPEIARELMVSLNTMRTHTKNIYSKLGVNNRRAAVRRAEELDMY